MAGRHQISEGKGRKSEYSCRMFKKFLRLFQPKVIALPVFNKKAEIFGIQNILGNDDNLYNCLLRLTHKQ